MTKIDREVSNIRGIFFSILDPYHDNISKQIPKLGQPENIITLTKDDKMKLEILDKDGALVSMKDVPQPAMAGNGFSLGSVNLDLTLPKGPNDKAQISVYKTRFWILGVFSLIVFIEFVVWGTFGSIMQSAEYAYEWNDGYIAILGSWGPINSVLFMAPMSWFNHKYGLRKGVLATATLITIGTAARCVTTDDEAFKYLASFAGITTGMASCLTQSLPAMISNTWFSSNERTTATAVGIITGQIASAAMYLSPTLVRAPKDGELSREEIKSDIRSLMFIHFGVSAFALLCALVYFPAKPPKPPSMSSTETRMDYVHSIKSLLRNRDFVLVMLAYVFLYTFPMMWFTVMNFSLECIGIEQNQSMYIAITASLVSAGTALLAARMTDYLQGYMKVTIASLVLIASAFFIWFLLITEKIIETSSQVPIYVAITGGVATSYAAVPIIVEFAVELAYPCPESAVGAILIFFMDSTGIIFLLLMIIPSECYRWLSYVLAFGIMSSIAPLLLAKEVHKRSSVDAEHSSNSALVSNSSSRTSEEKGSDLNGGLGIVYQHSSM